MYNVAQRRYDASPHSRVLTLYSRGPWSVLAVTQPLSKALLVGGSQVPVHDSLAVAVASQAGPVQRVPSAFRAVQGNVLLVPADSARVARVVVASDVLHAEGFCSMSHNPLLSQASDASLGAFSVLVRALRRGRFARWKQQQQRLGFGVPHASHFALLQDPGSRSR